MLNPDYEESESDLSDDEGVKGDVDIDDMDTKSDESDDKQQDQDGRTEADSNYLDLLEQIRSSDPALFFRFWIQLQTERISMPDELKEINDIRMDEVLRTGAHKERESAELEDSYKEQARVLCASFIGARQAIAQQEQSTTAESSNETRVKLRSNQKVIVNKDALAGQPFPAHKGIVFSETMPQDNPQEPLKVDIHQTHFFDFAHRIRSTEGEKACPDEKHKWEALAIEDVKADKDFLQGGARGSEPCEAALHSSYACDH